MHVPSHHEGVHQHSSAQIQSPPSTKATTFAPCTPQNYLRRERTACAGRRRKPITRHGGSQTHTGNCQLAPLLHSSSRQQTVGHTQYHRRPASPRHQKHGQSGQATTGLCCHLSPDSITHRASNMVLAVHSNASYLTKTNSHSRAGTHIYLTEDNPIPHENGPVLTLSQVIKCVMALAAEAESAAIYNTAHEMVPLQNALEEMGWPQPKSPIQTDNSTATGFIYNTASR